jgi:hypothetical protein
MPKGTKSYLHPLTTSDLAKTLGITTSYVHVLVYRGVFSRNADGLFDPTEAVPAYIEHHGAGLLATRAVDHDGRVRLTNAKADLLELKLKRMRDELTRSGTATV